MIPINNFADLKQFEASAVAFEMKYPKALTDVFGVVSYKQSHWEDEHYEISTFHKTNEQGNFIKLDNHIVYDNESVSIKMRKLTPSDAEKLVRTGNVACRAGGLCDLSKLASMDIARVSDAL